ncbi:uncharacterized protein LOC130908684 [Corythoichthys intestinalis]|uniref:uncharacterized protein LOC130908684 n=1 Tax=Corythoichthys intestinalis TaxID=161448 RepID=UPI0025A607AE|nr:uncharacterized protein LOC130908684 [Corythoichthys intestinalis]XP_057680363.1 uncharacterized protein LOC130908684 [Corythoichthys intestinalis]
MGASCCHPKSPCGSVEERSGLLNDDTKPAGSGGQVIAAVGGTCGPQDDDDDIKKAMDDTTLTVVDMEDVQLPIPPKHASPQQILSRLNGSPQKENFEASALSPEIATLAENDVEEDEMTLTEKKAPSEILQEVKGQCEGGNKHSVLAGKGENQKDCTQKVEISPCKDVEVPDICHHDGDSSDKMAESHSLVKELLKSNKEAFSPDTQEASENATFQENTLEPKCFSLVNNDSEVKVSAMLSRLKEKSHKTCAEPTEAPLCGDEQRPAHSSDVEMLTTTSEHTSSPHAAKESQQENIYQHAGEDPHGGQPEDNEMAEDEDKMGENNPEELVEEALESRQTAAEEVSLSSSEDLYRGAEEPPSPVESKKEEPFEMNARSSLGPVVNILSYSQKEWRGNTAKCRVIRKGYSLMSGHFSGLRPVRGDNYCALRATLYQVLSQTSQVPDWLQNDESDSDETTKVISELMGEWTFPGDNQAQIGVVDRLHSYLETLRNKWSEMASCSSQAERHRLIDDAFQGGEEEVAMLEALKVLMLRSAAQLHTNMQAGRDVPLFCWLLFARDSSDCPRTFLANHLSRVGISAGMEQVEMCLLGYALRHTLQVFRLYKANTEEFLAFYPDEHMDDWPRVTLVTEDDRHYNVPVGQVRASRVARSS